MAPRWGGGWSTYTWVNMVYLLFLGIVDILCHYYLYLTMFNGLLASIKLWMHEWGLLHTGKVEDSDKAMVESESSFSHAKKLLKCIHSLLGHILTRTWLFYNIDIISFSKPIESLQTCIQWLHCLNIRHSQDVGHGIPGVVVSCSFCTGATCWILLIK